MKLKFRGFKYIGGVGGEWVTVRLPRCKDGRFFHNIYRYHMGWYGPFGWSVGECSDCSYRFNEGRERYIQLEEQRRLDEFQIHKELTALAIAQAKKEWAAWDEKHRNALRQSPEGE